MARDLLLADVTTKRGHLNDSYIHDVTLVDIETLELYTCVVDESYNNYRRSGWDEILARPVKLGLYGNLRATERKNNEGFRVISADSRPQLIEALSETEMMQVIETRKEQLGLD